MKVHLVNAGKYFSKLIPPLIAALINTSTKVNSDQFWLYCLFQTIATLYCTVWDYYMDWGLFRCFDDKNYLLRKQIKYPARFYYVAMVTNFLLRFWWVINIWNFSYETKIGRQIRDLEFLVFLSIMAEAIRRTQWALIRVENEFFNNYEAYRTIPTIPNLMEDVQTTLQKI